MSTIEPCLTTPMLPVPLIIIAQVWRIHDYRILTNTSSQFNIYVQQHFGIAIGKSTKYNSLIAIDKFCTIYTHIVSQDSFIEIYIRDNNIYTIFSS